MSMLLLCTLLLLLISGCINNSPTISDGRWESDDPRMYINIGIGGGTAVSGENDLNNNIGELIDEDDSIIKIVFLYVHGNFKICNYLDDGLYVSGTDIYRWGL